MRKQRAHGGRWTDARVATLKDLWPTHSAGLIAKTLGGGITRNSCVGKAHRLGLVKKSGDPPHRLPRNGGHPHKVTLSPPPR